MIRSATLSLVKPNWVMMKPGALLRITARDRVNTTSSAVTGLPDANFRPGAMWNVVVKPSGEVSQRSAVSGMISFS